jgi:2-oxoglutarate dehydrogenase complex dehydrogenase (E1) component-like enzyme
MSKVIDWERIELDYRSGIKTLREIGEDGGVSHVAVGKRAKRDGWVRDLKAKIQAKAAELVTKQLVTREVTKERFVNEREIVEVNANAQASILLAHKSGIQRGRELSMKLMAELEAQTNDPELFEKLSELMNDPDNSGMEKLNEIFRKAIATPQRIDSMKKLAETMKNLIALERQAIGLDNEIDEGRADIANEIAKSRKRTNG